MASRLCAFCAQPLQRGLAGCPHCGRPSLFPNVDDAAGDTERRELAERYQRACTELEEHGASLQREAFETALGASCAVRALPFTELTRLAASDSMIAATYYQQINGKSRLPGDDKYDRLRRIADATAFPGYSEQIQFAALTIDERWPENYGEAAVFFKEEMIKHRTSLFEENLVLWFKSRGDTWDLPAGYRSVWEERHQLAVAKLGSKLADAGLDLGDAVLSCGKDTGGDSFIEAHIFGQFTIRSVTRVVFKKGYLAELALADLTNRAGELGFELRELT